MELNKEVILNELIQTKFVENYCRLKLTNKEIDIEEAIQHIYLIICEIEEEKLIQWYAEGGINKIRQVVSGIISRQLNSTNSEWFYTYVLKNPDNIIRKRINNKYEHYDEENGWSTTYKKGKAIKDDYETLDIEFKVNRTDNELVKALNQLSDEDRSIMIKYIECNNHYSELAREFNLSVDLIKEKINEIREKINKILSI
jgi:hypothetical protein